LLNNVNKLDILNFDEMAIQEENDEEEYDTNNDFQLEESQVIDLQNECTSPVEDIQSIKFPSKKEFKTVSNFETFEMPSSNTISDSYYTDGNKREVTNLDLEYEDFKEENIASESHQYKELFENFNRQEDLAENSSRTTIETHSFQESSTDSDHYGMSIYIVYTIYD